MKHLAFFLVSVVLCAITFVINAEMNRSEKPAIKTFVTFVILTFLSCLHYFYYIFEHWENTNKSSAVMGAIVVGGIAYICYRLLLVTWQTRSQNRNQNRED